MIIVFGSAYDEAAASLTARWAAHDAALLTSRDLSTPGWRCRSSSPASVAVLSGRVANSHEITGVCIRWPGVFPQELTHIAPADRDYVAAEMMAFLVWWLSTLRCPVVNRPTPLNLAGPAWRPEQWVRAARDAGIPVHPVSRRLTASTRSEVRSRPVPCHSAVTVVGERCFGAAEPVLRDRARRLARTAGVDVLTVGFDGAGPEAGFAGADLLPPLSPESADAVLALLTRDRG